MTRRTVLLLGLVALVAVWLAPIAVAASAAATAEDADVITVARSVATPAVTVAPRVHRGALVPVAAALVVAAVACSVACHRPAMQRSRHRFGDAGDHWRALLLGAPPVRA